MHLTRILRAACLLPFAFTLFFIRPVKADGDISKVKHVVVIMQENHSFDNYFGALSYAPGSPYHTHRAVAPRTTTAAWTA